MPSASHPSHRRRLAWHRHAGAAGARGLLGLLLLLQLAGFHAIARSEPAHPDLARLSAAIGQPVAICLHGGGALDRGTPGDQGAPDDCCPSCSLCHILVGAAILPPALVVLAPVTFVAAISRPGAASATPRAPTVAGASPRGPPTFV